MRRDVDFFGEGKPSLRATDPDGNASQPWVKAAVARHDVDTVVEDGPASGQAVAAHPDVDPAGKYGPLR